MIPGWLLAQRPDANDLLVYATLASFGRFDTLAGCYEECRPALATVAEQAGISVSSVKRGIGNLLRMGAVERQQRWAEGGKTQLPSVYRVIFGAIVGPQEQGGFTGDPRGESTREQGGSPRVSQDPEPSTQNHNTQTSGASADAPAEVNTAKLLGDWIDWLKAKGIETLPGQTKARYGRELKQALADGFTVKVIGKALQMLWQRGKAGNPQLLPHLLIEVQSTEPVSPAAPRQTFAQQDDLYKIAKEKLRKAKGDLINHLVEDKHVDASLAFKEGERWYQEELAKLAQGAMPMETNAGVPYIDGQVVPRDDTKEVTGS
jgi:hypothetical protein